jgi:hypothetical protein
MGQNFQGCDFKTKPSLRLWLTIIDVLYLSYNTPASPIEVPLPPLIGVLIITEK